MIAKGTFEVAMTPQPDEDAPAGRMILKKVFEGDLTGTGTGQMISKRLENGTAAYFAIEEFKGTVNGQAGSFTFMHRGEMTKESQSLVITILEGSGSDDLATVSGSLSIEQKNGNHSYELDYEL